MEDPTSPSGPAPGGDGDGRSRPGFLKRLWMSPRRPVTLAAGVIALCGLIALPVVALTSSTKAHPRSTLVFTSVPPTTTVAPTPTTAVPATTTTLPAATTTTTALVCHNSYNPACGAFRWSPAPAVDPVSVQITFSPDHPVAGNTVTFRVTYSDGNSVVDTNCANVSGGGGMGPNYGCQSAQAPSSSCPTRYGPWDPPAKQPSAGSMTYPYKYDTPGTYTFSAEYLAESTCSNYNPYPTQVSGSVQVIVGQANTPASPTSASAG